MFFGASGPLVAGIVKTLKLEPVRNLATHSALMSMQHFIKVLFSDFWVFLILNISFLFF